VYIEERHAFEFEIIHGHGEVLREMDFFHAVLPHDGFKPIH
jgi:hypothetical protein